MRLSYIVSAYNDLIHLPCVLHSLRAQTDQDFEVIVTDNSTTDTYRNAIRKITHDIFPGAIYMPTEKSTCFESADYGVKDATGDFVCFPSDDSYYMPMFGELMYAAAKEYNVDFVLCDMFYGPRSGSGIYSRVIQHPIPGWFDKTGFILKREKYQPFPNNKMIHQPRTAPALDSGDGLLAVKLVREGVSYTEIRDVLVVHN